jgi:hypothetical protein
VSTLAAAVITLVALSAAGAVPVLRLVGARWPALFLMPLGGSVVASAAGACSLAITGSILPWFFGIAAVVAAGVGGQWAWEVRRRGPSVDEARPRTQPGSDRVVGAAGVVLVLAAIAWSLRPLRVPSVGWDARAIWLLRGSWFAAGHQALRAGFENPQLLLAHVSYPPLISATVGFSWDLTGNHGYRLGVVVISLLNACAIGALAWVVVEAGRVAAARMTGRRGQLRADHAHRAGGSQWAVVPAAAGVLVAGLIVLATFGVIGPFATNGYADPLWSIAAVGAIGYGLLLPLRKKYVGAAGVLLAVCGLTKVEGTATAAGIVVLLVARWVASGWRRRAERPGGTSIRSLRPMWAPVLIGLGGLVALEIWPQLTKLVHATRDVNTSGARQGTLSSRAHLTFNAMTPHLHVLLLAVPVAVVGGMLLARNRRRLGLANDLWAWAGLAVGLVAVAGAYVTGPGNTAGWLLTSVHRTTMFPAIAAWLIIAVWAVVGAAGPEPAPVAATADPGRPTVAQNPTLLAGASRAVAEGPVR